MSDRGACNKTEKAPVHALVHASVNDTILSSSTTLHFGRSFGEVDLYATRHQANTAQHADQQDSRTDKLFV